MAVGIVKTGTLKPVDTYFEVSDSEGPPDKYDELYNGYPPSGARFEAATPPGTMLGGWVGSTTLFPKGVEEMGPLFNKEAGGRGSHSILPPSSPSRSFSGSLSSGSTGLEGGDHLMVFSAKVFTGNFVTGMICTFMRWSVSSCSFVSVGPVCWDEGAKLESSLTLKTVSSFRKRLSRP